MIRILGCMSIILDQDFKFVFISLERDFSPDDFYVDSTLEKKDCSELGTRSTRSTDVEIAIAIAPIGISYSRRASRRLRLADGG